MMKQVFIWPQPITVTLVRCGAQLKAQFTMLATIQDHDIIYYDNLNVTYHSFLPTSGWGKCERGVGMHSILFTPFSALWKI